MMPHGVVPPPRLLSEELSRLRLPILGLTCSLHLPFVYTPSAPSTGNPPGITVTGDTSRYARVPVGVKTFAASLRFKPATSKTAAVCDWDVASSEGGSKKGPDTASDACSPAMFHLCYRNTLDFNISLVPRRPCGLNKYSETISLKGAHKSLSKGGTLAFSNTTRAMKSGVFRQPITKAERFKLRYRCRFSAQSLA